MPRLDRVTEGELLVDLVTRATSLPGPDDDAGLLELAEDSMNRTLGDSNCISNFPHSDVHVTGDAEEHMAVIA